MKINAWRLPWRGEMVPHAVLDIQRGCNISCRACYNLTAKRKSKSIEEVTEELDTILKLRRLGSVSILGGEVTLNSQIFDIIRMVKSKGIHAEMLTNGVGVDAEYCRKLKAAGLDVVYFHIEKGQKRNDLHPSESREQINKLRTEKARMAGKEGLDVGLTATAFPGEVEDVVDIVSFTLKTPEVNYLLVTLYRDNSNVKHLTGDVISGFKGRGSSPDKSTLQNNNDIAGVLKNELKIDPFAFMGSNLDKNDPRWLSYLVGTTYQKDDSFHYSHLKVSLLEKCAMFILRLSGQFPMYMKQDPEKFRKQLMFNGLLGGRRKSNKELLELSRKEGAILTTKRLLFQNPAQLTDDGNLIYCEACPDAVLKNKKLVPVCITDSIS